MRGPRRGHAVASCAGPATSAAGGDPPTLSRDPQFRWQPLAKPPCPWGGHQYLLFTSVRHYATPEDHPSVCGGSQVICHLPHTRASEAWTDTAGKGIVRVRPRVNQTPLWEPTRAARARLQATPGGGADLGLS